MSKKPLFRRGASTGSSSGRTSRTFQPFPGLAKSASPVKSGSGFQFHHRSELVQALSTDTKKPRQPSKPGGRYAAGYGTPEEWSQMRKLVLARDRCLCRKCGTALKGKPWNCHHIVPLSRGGKTHPSNLIALCIPCHEKVHHHLGHK